MKTGKAKRIGFFAFDGFQGLDLAGPLEAFEQANQLPGDTRRRYETVVVTRDGQPVVADTGFTLGSHTSMEQCPPLHTLVIAGGAGARREAFPQDAIRWIARSAPRVSRLGSICTGLFVLAQTGLLDGQTVTTHWQHVEEAGARFPSLIVVSDALFVRHGKLFTAAGVSAGIDLALSLLRPTIAAASAEGGG